MLVCPKYNHQTVVPPDDGGPISFRWHFKRGILEPRMSGLELAAFILEQMPTLIPMFSAHPRVQQEFQAMLILLANKPKEALNEVLPWIRSVTREEEDDVILMSLFDRTPQPASKIYFLCM